MSVESLPDCHPLLQAVVWDIRHCALVRRLEGHRGAVFAVDLDSLARIAFTASGDKVEYSQGSPAVHKSIVKVVVFTTL